ncbi:MAG TPA: hypothetical protein VMH32_15320 [Burkholderiales bacterium]|nr:hypothetical protein [Burkholderiales bacterium]
MHRFAFAVLAVAGLLPSVAFAEEFGGTCAYGLAERGREVKTNCSINWTNPGTGKTYCFSSEQSKSLFLQDPEENIRKAEDRFAKLQKKQ